MVKKCTAKKCTERKKVCEGKILVILNEEDKEDSGHEFHYETDDWDWDQYGKGNETGGETDDGSGEESDDDRGDNNEDDNVDNEGRFNEDWSDDEFADMKNKVNLLKIVWQGTEIQVGGQ